MIEFSPYQYVGAEFLAKRFHAYLADDMGLGKSAQTIMAADTLGLTRILVICPAVARVNWKREWEKWSIFSQDFTVLEKLTDSPTERSICSYDFATENTLELIKDWELIIVDEAHFIKEPEAIRTKAIFGKLGLVRSTKRMWLLSGTPAPNHAGELWPALYTFGATTLKYEAFLQKFCQVRMVNFGGGPKPKVAGTKHESIPELRVLMNKIMLRRLKEDVLTELPPIKFDHIVVEGSEIDFEISPTFFKYVYPVDKRKELTEKVAKQDQALRQIWDLETEKQGHNFADTGSGAEFLQSIAPTMSTLRRWNGMKKVPAIIELVKKEFESKAYEKIVIFCIHQDVVELLFEGLKEFKPVTLYGNTDPKKRQQNIDKFQENPRCKVFIANIKAAGTAINLTAASEVLFVEQEWTPGDNAQACMRCHRRGQTKKVRVRFAGLYESIDEKISMVLRRKTRDLAAIYGEEYKPDTEFNSVNEGETK